MADFRFSMLFQANAAQAKAEVAAMRAEVTRLGQETAGAGRSAAGTGPAIGSVGDAARATAADLAAASAAGADWDAIVQATRAAIHPMVAEYQLLGEGLRQVAIYEEMGAMSAREAAVAHDLLARQTTSLIGRMEAAGVSVDGTTAAMTRQETAIQQLIARQTGLASATETSIAAQLQHGHALDAIRAQYDPLFAASREYELELGRIAEAERQGAISAGIAARARERAAQQMLVGQRQIGQTAQQANAHLANLGYQANDIFMMVAAGQNPLMLAIQQGTHLSQVFGMMRAEGQALGPAIRSALLGMINPVSLATMGVIALGAAAVQWFMSMSDEAVDAETAISDLEDAVRGFSTAASRSVNDVIRDFGRLTPEIVRLEQRLTALAEVQAMQGARAALESIGGDASGGLFQSDHGAVADLLGVSAMREGIAGGRALHINPIVAEFQSALSVMQDARGEAAQLQAVRELQGLLEAAAGGIGRMSAEQATFYGYLLDAEGALNRIVAAQAEAQRQQIDLSRALGEENGRMGGPLAGDLEEGRDAEEMARRGRARLAARDQIAADQNALEITRLRLAYGEQSAEVRAEEVRQAQAALEVEIQRSGIGARSLEAEQLRANLSAQLAMEDDRRRQSQQAAFDQLMSQYAAEQQVAALTAQYGADSLEVAYARAAAEREVMAAQIEAQGFTGQAAADLLAAWDAARGIASVDMASGVGAAAAQARLLAASLGISLQQSLGLMRLGAGKGPAGAQPRVSWGAGSALSGLGSGTGLTFGDNPGSAPPVNLPSVSAPTGAGAGGGAAAEADALAELLKREREQIAALQALSPLQAEIQRNHEALAKATDAERQEVIALIEERMRLEEVRDKLDEIGRTGEQAFTGLLTGAHSFADAISMVITKLAEMAASSAWDLLWNGAAGGGGLMGWLSGLLGISAVPAKADGGMVVGPGGPREDKLLHLLSAGEFVVNAYSTAAHLPLLEAINAGVPVDRLVDLVGGRHLPALADGGLAGVGASAPGSWRNWTGGGSASTGGGPAPGTQPGSMRIALEIGMDQDGNWEARVRDIATEASGPVAQVTVEQWSRKALPGRMAQIQSDPRRIG